MFQTDRRSRRHHRRRHSCPGEKLRGRHWRGSEIAGSFAGLGMVLNAILTALLVPLAVRMFEVA
jgi:hypothetical protein